MLAALFFFAACGGGGQSGGSGNAPGPARIVLNTDTPRPTIDVVDVPAAAMTELAAIESRDRWTAVFKVSVGADQAPMVGQYAIEDGRVRFTPMFPLDHGRQYHVTFAAPGSAARDERGRIAREGHHANDAGRDGVSDDGCRSRESTAHLHSFLRADGQPGRPRLRAPAR